MIKISIETPPIPAGAVYTHNQTSWQILDSAQDYGVVEESLNDAAHLTSYTSNIDADDDTYYARVKVHFSNGTATPWSRPIHIRNGGSRFTTTASTIETPKLSIEQQPSNVGVTDLVVTGSEFNQLSGGGTHSATKWELVDVDGLPLWEHRDTDSTFDLTTITIPKAVLKERKAYILRCVYQNEHGVESAPGELHFTTSSSTLSYLYA